MPRPRLSDHLKERLLDVGVETFRRQGYHGTGIKEVLDRVKIPKGSFYNYFDSKETFGAAAIARYADGLGEKLTAALAKSRDPLAGLRLFFRGLMKEYEAAGYIGGCLMANLGGELEGNETCRTALSRAFEGLRAAVREVLARGQEQGAVRTDIDAADLADLLINAWEGAVIRMKIERSLAPLRQCLRYLLDDYFKP